MLKKKTFYCKIHVVTGSNIICIWCEYLDYNNTNTIFGNTQLSVMQSHSRVQVFKSLKKHHNKFLNAKRPIFR